MSFAFTVSEEKWGEAEDGEELRTLLTCERLYDTSLVTYPAYEGTDGGMRDQAAEVVLRHRGYDPRSEERGQRRGAGALPELTVARHRLLAARHRLPLPTNG
jgi:phage head maturation protease